MQHTYATQISWSGSTANGYDAYSRNHRGVADPAPAIDLSADPHFRGDPAHLNPEQLLVLAASSCQLLTFLSHAARAGIDIVDYRDAALGTMDDAAPRAGIGDITLTPTITVRGEFDADQVRELVERAHKKCFIANSVTSRIRIEPRIESIDGA